MRIKFGGLVFRPMPWLTFFTLVCLAILISLGTWQYKRLIWKTDLLEQIDQTANRAPLKSLALADALLAADKPLDFRRIELNGRFVPPTANNGRAFHLMRSDGKRYYWRLYQPYQDGAELAYVATHDFMPDSKDAPPEELAGSQAVIGYVCMVQPANRFTPKSTPSQNRWFAFNGAPDALNWADAVDGEQVQTLYFIDWQIGANSADTLPVRIPDIPNNHFDYMLTWYSFVFILLAIYLILHRKTGRLFIEKTGKK